MNNIPECHLYDIINKNLEYVIDENLSVTFDNIKNVTINFKLLSNYLYETVLISENDFFEYFKNQEASTIGRFIQSLLVTSDIAAGTAVSGIGFNSYITTLFTNAFGVGTIGSIAGSILSSIGPLLLLVFVFFILKKINKNEALNVFFMVRNLNKLSKLLKFPITSQVNSEFKNLIQNKCSVIDDKNLKIECAINGYSKFLNEFVLTDLIKKYVEHLINNNENLSEIRSFNELARFKSQSNRSISNLMNNFYYSYIKFLNGLNINKSIIGDNFRLLNNATETALKRYINV